MRVKTADFVFEAMFFFPRCVLFVDDDADGIVMVNVAGATATLCDDDPPPALAAGEGFTVVPPVPGATALPPPPPPPQATTLSPAMMPSAITLERLNIRTS